MSTAPTAPEAPASITLAGGTYRTHPPKSAARAASAFAGDLDRHVLAAAIIGLCADCHGIPWQGKAGIFGERVFDHLQAKGVTFQEINEIGASLMGLATSVILLEREVAEAEDFTAAPQAG